MKKEKLFIIIPIVIIVALLAVIGYQLAKSQFDSLNDSNTPEPTSGKVKPGVEPGQGTPGGGGQSKGPAPGSNPSSE